MTLKKTKYKNLWILAICVAAFILGIATYDMAYAQTATSTSFPSVIPPFRPNFKFVEESLEQASSLISVVIPTIISLSLLVFLAGMVRFMNKVGDEPERDRGRKLMIWGIIILFVMTAVWSLVSLLGYLSGVSQGGSAQAPGPTL